MKKVIKFRKSYGLSFSIYMKIMTMSLLFLLFTFYAILNAQITQTNTIYTTADVILYDNFNKKEDSLSQKISSITNIIHIIDADVFYNLEYANVKKIPHKERDRTQILPKTLIAKNSTPKNTKNNDDIHSIKKNIVYPNSNSNSYFTKTEKTLTAIQNYSKNKIIFTTQKHTTDKIAASIVVKKYYITRFISITDAVTSSIRPPPFKT